VHFNRAGARKKEAVARMSDCLDAAHEQNTRIRQWTAPHTGFGVTVPLETHTFFLVKVDFDEEHLAAKLLTTELLAMSVARLCFKLAAPVVCSRAQEHSGGNMTPGHTPALRTMRSWTRFACLARRAAMTFRWRMLGSRSLPPPQRQPAPCT
jgi:hypothetical protein